MRDVASLTSLALVKFFLKTFYCGCENLLVKAVLIFIFNDFL